MKEFKFIIQKPKRSLDSDELDRNVVIIAKYNHHVYPLASANYDEHEIKTAIALLKMNLISEIINAEFEVEEV
jgi:hypothetical protein